MEDALINFLFIRTLIHINRLAQFKDISCVKIGKIKIKG